jgi:cytochrome b6-f complex iron-sulfur subunit
MIFKKNPEISRRSFLSLLGWAWLALIAAALGGFGLVLRFFFPNVTREMKSKFKAGLPGAFSRGVNEQFKDSHRVWIVRNQKGFYALSATCTHLGCTPNWQSSEQKFKCPCHGSGFYATGVNFEGPAPRALSRYGIALAEDGQIEVDTSVEYRQEKGQWGQEGSFLKYKD